MEIEERVRRLAFHTLVLVLAICGAPTAAFADVAVPPALRGWEDWALQGHETHRCPWLARASARGHRSSICRPMSAAGVSASAGRRPLKRGCRYRGARRTGPRR